MHKTTAEAKAFIQRLAPLVSRSPSEVWLAVPFTAVQTAAHEAQGSNIVIGAQNANDHEEGAFTGEVSCRMLKEAGAKFVLLGHSERRHYFHETDAFVNKKVKRALKGGLKPIVCIGETLHEHEEGMAFQVLQSQLVQSLEGIDFEELRNIIIAYEPVWAIGTNQAASAELAQGVHLFCREILANNWGASAAEKTAIIYGGSVKPDNALKLLSQPDIDGLLVGAASLSFETFNKIVECGNMNII